MNLDHEPVWLSAEAVLVEDWVINLDAGRSMLMVRLQEKCFLHPITHIRFLLGSPPYVVSASGCLTHLARSSDCMWFWISLPLASCRDLNQRRKDMSSLFTQKCKYYLNSFFFFFVINYVLNYVLYRSIKRVVSYILPRPGCWCPWFMKLQNCSCPNVVCSQRMFHCSWMIYDCSIECIHDGAASKGALFQ